MPRRSALRASDADRERVVERLRQAAAEGRILTEELEQRLEASFAARTYGQLDAVLVDLPGGRLAGPGRSRERGWLRPTIALVLAAAALTVVTLVIVLAVAGLLATWMLWLLAGWFFFSRRRSRAYGTRRCGSRPVCGGWHSGRSPQRWV